MKGLIIYPLVCSLFPVKRGLFFVKIIFYGLPLGRIQQDATNESERKRLWSHFLSPPAHQIVFSIISPLFCWFDHLRSPSMNTRRYKLDSTIFLLFGALLIFHIANEGALRRLRLQIVKLRNEKVGTDRKQLKRNHTPPHLANIHSYPRVTMVRFAVNGPPHFCFSLKGFCRCVVGYLKCAPFAIASALCARGEIHFIRDDDERQNNNAPTTLSRETAHVPAVMPKMLKLVTTPR
jgi:hypothetical protein